MRPIPLLRPLMLLSLSFLFIACPRPSWAKDSPDRAKGPHIWVRLVCEQTFFNIKQTSVIGVFFMMEKGWHVYWKNPGDSGQTPSIKWILPQGFKAGNLMWPLPERIHIPSLTDFGYKDQVVLMAPLEVPSGLKIGSVVTLKADVNWLVCNDKCIPGHAVLSLRVPVQQGVPKVPFKDVSLFAWGHASLADPLPGDWTSKGSTTKDGFELGFTTGNERIAKADFFPLDPDVVDIEPDPVFQGGWGASFSLKLKKSDQLLKAPASLRGLLVTVDGKGRKAGYWTDVPIK